MLEPNKIYQMDCIKGMQCLKTHSVDVVVTSPPYNIGIEYDGDYQDNKPRMEYLDWMETVAKESKRILKDNGSFFLNVGGTLKDPWIPIDVAERFQRHFILQNTIHWIKAISIPNNASFGHFKPINSRRFHFDSHEYVWHFTKFGDVELNKVDIGVPYQDKSNIERWKGSNGMDKRDRGNVWFIPYETINRARPHPSPFPKELPVTCIRDHGIKPNMVVLDPFIGIGTTGIACVELGVNFIGFEINTNYIRIANDRLVVAKS